MNDNLIFCTLENVQLLDKYNLRNPSKGTLYFATTHLIFVDHEMRKETWILLMHISSVERLPITTTGSPLLVRTKTFQSVFFVIPRERDCHEMHQTLLRLSQPVHIDELYCFHYKSTPDDLPKSAGWNFFDIQTEYQRMNVPNDQWVLCNANKDYELCDTYPSAVYVPARASTAVLLGSASFRSRGRLPVLAYLHHNKAAIARCSQPLSGFSARCMEDEQMLDLIRRANPNCGYMYVVDTRPRINAMVNRAAGKGYENEAFYENIKFQFMGIGNIHVMRKSLLKLVETCDQNTPTMSSFLSGLESSGWLKHIKSILDTSWWIACALESGVSVCVHCSDGWDRTAQVCSLAALCLDPHYRTINGYQALIEKDWLSFGHKFTHRCGHIACDGRERSPVFTQLLDCTWQLLRQRPEAFQFNERFLLTLHDHAHACQYGTFVGNCEKDRRDLRLSERSFSLWGYMASHLNEYKNPLYNPKSHPDVLKPDLNAQSIRFWRGMYCRYESGVHPREPLGDLLPAATEHCSALEHHINYLTKVQYWGRSCCPPPQSTARAPHQLSHQGTVLGQELLPAATEHCSALEHHINYLTKVQYWGRSCCPPPQSTARAPHQLSHQGTVLGQELLPAATEHCSALEHHINYLTKVQYWGRSCCPPPQSTARAPHQLSHQGTVLGQELLPAATEHCSALEHHINYLTKVQYWGRSCCPPPQSTARAPHQLSHQGTVLGQELLPAATEHCSALEHHINYLTKVQYWGRSCCPPPQSTARAPHQLSHQGTVLGQELLPAATEHCSALEHHINYLTKVQYWGRSCCPPPQSTARAPHQLSHQGTVLGQELLPAATEHCSALEHHINYLTKVQYWGRSCCPPPQSTARAPHQLSHQGTVLGQELLPAATEHCSALEHHINYLTKVQYWGRSCCPPPQSTARAPHQLSHQGTVLGQELLPAATEHCSALEHHSNLRITTFKNLLGGKKADKNKETTVVNYQNGNVNSVEIETKTEELQIDNKLLYESGGTLSELECANHDHPLKDTTPKSNKIFLITEKTDDTIPATFALLEKEVNTVALDWKSIKNVTECSCSTPLDHFSRKHHCWGCGRCVCTRCVCARAPLPALAAPRPAPLCAACAPEASAPATPATPAALATPAAPLPTPAPEIVTPAN
ncbi:unnamed protein product [Arctia plantaginis]|uniref:phosphatidylinositol-3,5-bisphosphate 3-phosphatase n=1 Tax=Arctia plantaginis TaxID=874455 RepID=A0A8S0YZR9_ARCPL|nr:unnamed protein product [Arctia plantaginis]